MENSANSLRTAMRKPLPLSPCDPGAVDFRAVFDQSAMPQLLLDTSLVILDATDAYLAATMTKRSEIVGRHLFEVFPDNPGESYADGVSNLRASLMRVLQTRAPDEMAVQKYDIRREGSEEFEVRYWRPLNWPILGDDGFVALIVHQVFDVTSLVQARR